MTLKDEDGNLNDTGSNFRQWTPIGNNNNRYAGTFDGQNDTISGLYIDSSEEYCGLFGYMGSDSKVQNVGVIDNYIKSLNSFFAGGIVGVNDGTIADCYYLNKEETDELDGTTFKTTEQFASGEVAYLLQQVQDEQTTQVWGQDLSDKNSFPELNGDKVYYSENGCHGYSNTKNEYIEHTLDADGTHCIICDKKKTTIELTEDTFTYNSKPIDADNLVTSDSTSEISFVLKSGKDILDGAPINAGEYQLIVSIKENETYIDGNAEYDIEIVQATPEIENVTAFISDNTLDADKVILKATTSVDGTLKLKDNTEIKYGTHEYDWIFTPDDSQNYKSVEGKVTLTANEVTTTTTSTSTTTSSATKATTETVTTTNITTSSSTTTETKPNEIIIQFEYKETKAYFSHNKTEFSTADLFKSITMVETDENGIPIEDTRVDIMNDVHFGGESPSSIFKSESGYIITTVQAYYGEEAITGALPTVTIGVKGDVNLNGTIDLDDAICALRYYSMNSAALNPTFSDDEILQFDLYDCRYLWGFEN